MDLEEGFAGSKPEKGEVEQDSEIQEKKSPVEGIAVEINGGDVGHDAESETGIPAGMTRGDGIGERRANGSSPEPAGSHESASSTPPASKGYGLRRWRRIWRDFSGNDVSGADSGRILKRGLSIAETVKDHIENKQKSDGEVESSAASVDLWNSETVLHSPEPTALRALDPELELLVAGGVFSVGMDSENSEDRSSKSSTAASAPKLKHEGLGFGRERNRVKNLGGKGLGHAMQSRVQRGKGVGVDISKKLRGDHVRWEKENSRSSVESDLRSSNAVFFQWGSSVSDGRQNQRRLNYDGENSDEAQMGLEVQGDLFKETGGVDEDTSRENVHADVLGADRREEGESFQPNVDGDLFAESLNLLQAAQEALEKEIQKFGELRKEPIFSDYSSAQYSYEEAEGSNSPSLEAKVTELSQKVEHLDRALEDASIAVKAKESRVHELEAVVDGLLKKEPKDSELLQEQFKEMDLEFESLFMKKIEAESESLVLRSMTEKWKITCGNQLTLVEGQKCLAKDYEEMNIKLKDTETKAVMLKREAEKLEFSCKELLGTEEVLKLQNRVSKFSLCCFIQSMMLFVAFGLFLIRLLPPTSDVVPT